MVINMKNLCEAKKVLMTGDSITDCERNRDNPQELGKGYPALVGAYFGHEQPCEYKFYNTGISGNRVTDLLARWREDCLNLKPDYLSILIGVNDVWHEISSQNGVETKLFEKIYDILLEETIKALPNIKIILMTPYILKGSATSEKYDEFIKGLSEKTAAIRALAEKYQLPTIDLQAEFDKALCKASEDAWSYDGVHPTIGGHQVIAGALIKHLDKCFK